MVHFLSTEFVAPISKAPQMSKIILLLLHLKIEYFMVLMFLRIGEICKEIEMMTWRFVDQAP